MSLVAGEENATNEENENFLYFLVDCHLNILKISSIILKLCCEIMHEGHKVCCDDRNKSCYGIISCPLGWFCLPFTVTAFL